MGGQKLRVGDGVGACEKNCSTVKTWTPEQSIVSREAQWTQPWSRVQSQIDAIHLVCSTGAIVSIPHLHSVKNCSEKSRPIKYGDWMHSVMIAIEYSYVRTSWGEKKLIMVQTT